MQKITHEETHSRNLDYSRPAHCGEIILSLSAIPGSSVLSSRLMIKNVAHRRCLLFLLKFTGGLCVDTSDNLRLDNGKCAIITGAGAGIGKEIAITFATAGACLWWSAICNADAANHVVDEIQQLGGQAFACRCDITSEQELSALADFAVSKLGKVDILVNNAGGGGPKPFDMPMARFSPCL